MKLKKILYYVLAMMFFVNLVPTANAASLTNLKNSMTNTAPSTVSNHTIQFNVPTGLTLAQTGKEIDLTIPSFSFGSVDHTDIDLSIGGSDIPLVAGATPGAGQIGYVRTGDLVQFYMNDDLSIPAAAAVVIKIGTHATGGDAQLTNPVAGTYQMKAWTLNDTTDPVDEGTLSVVILSSVTVTTTVQSSLTFSVNAVTTGDTCTLNGGATYTPSVSTSSTEIPFGVLTPGTSKRACQRLVTTTNATNGYVTTVQQNNDLVSAATDYIYKFDSNTGSLPLHQWDSYAGSDHGYFGFHAEDVDYTAFSGNNWAGIHNATENVATASGPVDTAGGTNYVNYQIEVDNLQPAGVYTNTLTYICTATF